MTVSLLAVNQLLHPLNNNIENSIEKDKEFNLWLAVN